MPLIIVVDDRVTNRRIFSRLSASVAEGVDVESFGAPEDVLTWMQTRTPDLVITDYKMPGMDGSEFIRRLRQIGPCADVPVMVITAYEDRDFRLRALEAGATDFLQSPVDHQEFLTRARNLLRLGLQQKTIRERAVDLERELAISERSRETAIRDSRTRLVQVIDTIPAVISAVDDTGRRVFVNAFGNGLLPAAGLAMLGGAGEHDRQVLETGRPAASYEEEVVDRQGQRRTFLTSKYPLLDDEGAVRNVLTTSFDISERKQAERQLHHLAHHDALTGLPNRLMVQKVIADELTRATQSGTGFALHFLDLDRFKSINDGFGHAHGDRLLMEIAARLRQETREEDTVARLGGDEFAIVQVDVQDRSAAHEFASRIINAISETLQIDNHQTSIGASIGITMAPMDAQTPEQLLKNADLAMYCAKREGRKRASFFSSEMQTVARNSVLLEIDLRASVERGDFVICYQPQVDVTTHRLIGAEALLRWRRPGHGLVGPQSFLSLAEETGLMGPINRWVLNESCRQAAIWSRSQTPVRVGVNVASISFRTENIRDLVIDTLDRTGLDPSLLELEITESTLMENQREVADDLHALRRLGVRVAIDDFGTGYSSLAYLQHLPIDRLKIDRSFVRNLGTEEDEGAIVRAVVGIGRSMGMEVLAEGVERSDQLRCVLESGCQSVQGFLFSPALPATDFGAFLPLGMQLPTREPVSA